MNEGPPRAYMPMVLRMKPQQVPWFRYREVPLNEAGKRLDAFVTFEEWEAKGKDGKR